MNFGFGISNMMFSIVPIFIMIIFLFIIGTIITSAINYGKQKSKPQESIGARIISKRQYVWSGGGNTHGGGSRTSNYVTFESENGERVEYMVPSNKVGLLAEGDLGTLTHQGTLFIEFSRVKSL